MAQWGTDDTANNSPNWSPSLVKLTPNTANRDSLYGNTTADAFVDGQTVGIHAVAQNEIAYAEYTLSSVIVVEPGEDVILTSNATTGFVITGGTKSVNAVLNVATLVVSGVAVNAAGEGYETGDLVEVDDGTGTAAVLSVTANATGNVTSLDIVSGGSYTAAPSAAANTTASTGNGTGLVVDLTIGAGSFTVANAGVYTVLPTGQNELTAQANQTGANVVVEPVWVNTADAKAVAHTGWVKRTVGSGGRAGRVQVEVLVAGGISSDGANTDDGLFPEVS